MNSAVPAASVAQSQSGAASGVPSVAIPKTTEVLVIETPKKGVTPQQIMAVIAEEIRATVKLYLDGKVRQWYSRGDGKGVIFLVDAKTEDEARAIMETLALAKEQLVDHQYIPVGPLMREARLEHIVGMTQWLASPSHPSLMTRQHWLVDRLFSMAPGVAHTIVRPGIFADAYLATIGSAVHLGIFPWMSGNSRNAPPSNEDIARVAVAALMDPARHAGKSYRPTGPELLGVEEMANAVGRAVGRSVRFVPTPTWLFMKAARMSGYPIDLFSGIRYYIDDHERGAFELGAPTTDVLDVTGRPAEDFETIARRYAAPFRNQRTFGNWLREFAQFMLTPLSPGFNLDRYDRELRRPFPRKPQFSTDSKVWRREHGITEPAKSAAAVHTKANSGTSRPQWLESQ